MKLRAVIRVLGFLLLVTALFLLLPAILAYLYGEDGRPAAVLISWQSIGVRQPRAVELHFDGEPLQVTDPRRTPLPPYDPKRIHFVSAVVRFTDQTAAACNTAFAQ